MKIYLASRYSRLEEMQEVAAMLRRLGHVVTSRWIIGDHQVHDYEAGTPEETAKRIRFAQEDLADLRAADCCISFTEPPRSATRGGRHVEFGVAIERGMRCILVGPREHVFHWLPQVEYFESAKAVGLALGFAPGSAG